MCGIVGYTGPKDLVKVLLDGLTALEYRGYDSAGIALSNGDGFTVHRKAGKLGELKAHLAAVGVAPHAESYGIGHTRWATHGRPSDANAHPHADCGGRVQVVHNGIIENFDALRGHLAGDGHRFGSETDTEVIAHLVEHHLRHTTGGDLAEAVRATVLQLEGAYAIVCVAADSPGVVVAARSGPPLVVGFGDGEGLVASDVMALIPHTRDVAALGDREIAIVTRAAARLVRFDGGSATFHRQHVTWDVQAVEKGGHPHYMLKEIMEQPDALLRTITAYVTPERDRPLMPEGTEFQARLDDVDRVVVVACGTSYHAAMLGRSYVERLARLPAQVDIGSEYRYGEPVLTPRTLAVFVTQSGETADTLAALREARRLGALTLAVTNMAGSMATREAHAALVTQAGPEVGVASSKTFTAQIAALHLLALHLADRRRTLSGADVARRIGELFTLPQLLEAALQGLEDSRLPELAASFVEAPGFLFLGRGLAYPIALEGALKLKELSYIHAEGYPAGELKHGPIALIEPSMPVMALAPGGTLREKMLGSIQEVRAREGNVIGVCQQGDREVARLCRHVIEVPRAPESLMPLLLSVPMQLFAYHVAVARGCDVDQPRNLAKSVTVE